LSTIRCNNSSPEYFKSKDQENLTIPTFGGLGRVKGLRDRHRRGPAAAASYPNGKEIELAQALRIRRCGYSNSMNLPNKAGSRQFWKNENRMARDIHDTLAQGSRGPLFAIGSGRKTQSTVIAEGRETKIAEGTAN